MPLVKPGLGLHASAAHSLQFKATSKHEFFGPPLNQLPVVANLSKTFTQDHSISSWPHGNLSSGASHAPTSTSLTTSAWTAKLSATHPNLPRQHANVDANGRHVVTGQQMPIGVAGDYNEFPGFTAAFNVAKDALSDGFKIVDGVIDANSRLLAATLMNAKGVSAQPGQLNLKTEIGADGKPHTKQVFSKNSVFAAEAGQAVATLAKEVWDDGLVKSAERFGRHVGNQMELASELFERGYPVQATEVNLQTGSQVLAVAAPMTGAGVMATTLRLPSVKGSGANSIITPSKSNVVHVEFNEAHSYAIGAAAQVKMGAGGRRGPVHLPETEHGDWPTARSGHGGGEAPSNPGVQPTITGANPEIFSSASNAALEKMSKELGQSLEVKVQATQELINRYGSPTLGELGTQQIDPALAKIKKSQYEQKLMQLKTELHTHQANEKAKQVQIKSTTQLADDLESAADQLVAKGQLSQAGEKYAEAALAAREVHLPNTGRLAEQALAHLSGDHPQVPQLRTIAANERLGKLRALALPTKPLSQAELASLFNQFEEAMNLASGSSMPRQVQEIAHVFSARVYYTQRPELASLWLTTQHRKVIDARNSGNLGERQRLAAQALDMMDGMNFHGGDFGAPTVRVPTGYDRPVSLTWSELRDEFSYFAR